MDIILLGTALAFFITYMSIPVIITVSERKKLFDEPDARKLHLTPVPSLGGLGIFAGLMMGDVGMEVPCGRSPLPGP